MFKTGLFFRIMRTFFAEASGTFILALAVGLTTDPISTGLILVVLLYIGYPVADMHYNPAVSLGSWALGETTTREMAARVAAQFSGGGVAAYLLTVITKLSYLPQPADSTGVVSFIFVETIFSFVFVLLFLKMTYPGKQKRSRISGLVIGAGFAGCLMVVRPIAGLGLHPALTTMFMAAGYFEFGGGMPYLPVYFFGPLLGALMAGGIYRFIIRVKAGNTK